jgi:probable rRNA maturation factor
MSTTTSDAGAATAPPSSGRDDADPSQPPRTGDDDQPPRESRSVVDLQDRTGRLPADALDALRARAASALAAACRETGADPDAPHEVRVTIVDDEAMTRLHADHMDDPATTDVLTFDLRDDHARRSPTSHPLDVEIALCLDEAQRQSINRRHPLDAELLLYLVHALLHCLGRDDRSEEDARAMRESEDNVFHALGLDPVFGAASTDPTRGGAAR